MPDRYPWANQYTDRSSSNADVKGFGAVMRKEVQAKTDEAREGVEQAVRTLAQQALSQTDLISSSVRQSIEAIIAQLDKKLTEQVNQILHHEDFQRLEGSWRGLSAL